MNKSLVLVTVSVACFATYGSFQETLEKADAGDNAAQISAAETFAKGGEVSKDILKAEEYYKMAISGGNEHAERALILLYISNGMIDHWDDIASKIGSIASYGNESYGLDAEMLENAPVFSRALVEHGDFGKREAFDKAVIHIAQQLYEVYRRKNGGYGFDYLDSPELMRYKDEISKIDELQTELERKAREEKARIAQEKAEAERKVREEEVRIAMEKAEAERKAREEEARIAQEKAEAERKAREEEARIAQEKAEELRTWAKLKAEEKVRALMQKQAKESAERIAIEAMNIAEGKRREKEARDKAREARKTADKNSASATTLSSGGLFAKQKETEDKTNAIFSEVLHSYFGNWKNLLRTEPMKDKNGNMVFDVDYDQHYVKIKIKVSVNESTYAEWKRKMVKKLTDAGLKGKENEKFTSNGFPTIFFKVDLLDDGKCVVRSRTYPLTEAKRKVKNEATGKEWGQAAALGKDLSFATQVSALSGEDVFEKGRVYDVFNPWESEPNRAFPLQPFSLRRLRESPNDWAKEVKYGTDDEAAYFTASFEKLKARELDRVASVQCAILDESDMFVEKIAEARKNWDATEAEAVRPIIKELLANMMKIPGKDCALGRRKITEKEWVAFMGNEIWRNNDKVVLKPEDDKTILEKVGYEPVSEFILKLNAHPDVALLKTRFRLPSLSEWKTAFLAGSEGSYPLLPDGSENEKMDKVPNLWGFCIYGDAERINQNEGKTAVLWSKYNYIDTFQPGWREEYGFWSELSDSGWGCGFRLCANWSPELEAAIRKAYDELEEAESAPISSITSEPFDEKTVPSNQIVVVAVTDIFERHRSYNFDFVTSGQSLTMHEFMCEHFPQKTPAFFVFYCGNIVSEAIECADVRTAENAFCDFCKQNKDALLSILEKSQTKN